MTPENWMPLLQAMEPYPALRSRLAEPGLTLDQRVALLRQAGFDVTPQELLRWRSPEPAGGDGGGGTGEGGGGEALSEAALDAASGGVTLTFTNQGGGTSSWLVFQKPTQPVGSGIPPAWQVLTGPA